MGNCIPATCKFFGSNGTHLVFSIGSVLFAKPSFRRAQFKSSFSNLKFSCVV